MSDGHETFHTATLGSAVTGSPKHNIDAVHALLLNSFITVSQGSALEEILTDSWDSEPDARLSAPCIADRLVSLQSDHNVPVKHLQASICVATV